MNNEQRHIADTLNYLADYCLEHNGEYREYKDVDLVNAMLCFQEVFMSKMFYHQQEGTLSLLGIFTRLQGVP